MKKFKAFLTLFLAVCLMAGLLCVPVQAVEVGDSYSPDMTAWGTQNNNGWYYMYRTADGTYRELTFYDSTASVSWQRNAFSSDPNTDGEMYFISKTEFFVGENGTCPAYVFEVPVMGQIAVTLDTHGQSDMRITVYCNDAKQKTLSINTTGPNAGFTSQSVVINANANDRIYLVGSTTGTNREAWVNNLKVSYLTVGTHPDLPEDPEENEENDEDEENPEDEDYDDEIPSPAAGVCYEPDFTRWGVKSNNCWRYQYRSVGGQYADLTYYDSTASIAWQKNAYAFDPSAMNEMLFINKNSCFTGENGSVPVYTFVCPSGGTVELTVLTHGQPDMQMEILKNNDTIQTVSFSTTGADAGFTKTSVQIDVKKETKLYLVVSSTGTDREAWVKNYSVTYLSVSDEEEEPEKQTLYTPEQSAWGEQNNNCWYYLAKGKDNVYSEMTWWDADSDIDWQRNSFASDPNTANEMYFISWQKFFLGELQTKPVYGFCCPSGGQVELTFITHGETTMYLDVLQNKTLVDTVPFSTDGPEAGFTKHTYTLDVKKGTWIYLEGGGTGTAREGYVSYYAVEYLSFNDEVEETDDSIVGTVYTPDMDTLTQNNNGWYYMYYDQLFQRYETLTRYGANASIDWQRNAFAFDPNQMCEMLLMTNGHYFIGENGSCPVYAFKCPAGGDIQLKVFTHGQPDMYMQVYHNGTKINRYTYTTTGEYQGFTEHIEEFSVAKGDWIYLVCGSTGTDRDGWLSFYGVEYLSESDAVGGYGQATVYTPDIGSGWGTQNNNGWTFQYLDKEDNLFRKLAFVRADNMFEGTTDGGYEYLLCKQLEMHPARKASPAKVFTAETGGKIQVSFMAWMQAPDMSKTGTGIAVYHNGTKVWPEEEDWQLLDGTPEIYRVTVDAAAGDDIAIVLDAIEENVTYDATNVRVCARYLSTNDSVRTEWPEYPEEVAPTISDGVVTPTESASDTTEVLTSDTEEQESGEEGEKSNALVWIFAGLVAIAAAAVGGIYLFLKKKKQ